MSKKCLMLNHLKSEYLELPFSYQVCLKGHVLLVYFQNKCSRTTAAKKVGEKYGLLTSKSHIKCVVNSINLYKKNLLRNMEKFQNICSEVFFKSATTTGMIHEIRTIEAPPVLTSDLSYVNTIVPIVSTESSAFLLSSPGYSTPGESQPLLSRLRGIQLSPRKKILKQRLTMLENEFSTKIEKHKKVLSELKEKFKSRPYRLKQLNQTIARKNKTIMQLRNKLNEQSFSIQLKCLQNKNLRLKKQIALSKTEFTYQVNILNNQISDRNAEIQILQNKLLILKEEVEQTQHNVQNTRYAKVYTTDIRALIYDMLVCNVPTHSVPSLLHKIGEFTGYQFTEIPHRTTVEQMMRELGVISDLQTTEIAIATKNLTLGFDATRQEGVHVNAVHFTTKTRCMVVAVDQLAGGTANDYQSHMTQSVDHLAKLYSNFYEQKYIEIRSKIIANISNTMSDRVAANHATVTKLNTLWQKSLNELNCHLHPLDTMTSACKSSLKVLETFKGKLFGRDCIAANIVIQLNKLRYKDGKSDPKGFVIFLDKHKLPRGLLPRYRGNRLHVLFHTCGILIHNYTILKTFLFSGVTLCGGLRNSLYQDFTSEAGILELCALGLIGKLLTGP
ncbi:uncharacterized protein LOC124817617 isoform X1 [Hydra vulgaris]|uniref:uncharacterized protein LOC124817617 isoform X1 n=1 Tax=Hydra vulgaris TaxID=6087 RepID=UPI0032E9E8B1